MKSTISNLTVCKANQLIEATYRLSLNEHRILNACIAQIDSLKPLSVNDKFELSASDFAKLFGISESRAYTELQDIAKTLYQRSITIYNPDPSQPKITKIETRWISVIGYLPADGKIFLHFSQYILPYLSELKGQFTKYELKNISGLKSIYAFRLYELLMQWKQKGSREIEIEWLKAHFEIQDKYPAIKDFKLKVIEPAIKDINEKSNYQVIWTQRKTGKFVTHLNFTFTEKEKKSIENFAWEILESEQVEQLDLLAVRAEPEQTEPEQTREIKLSDDERACLVWAKKHTFWATYTSNTKSFLTCFNDPDGQLKPQWIATLPQSAKPKAAKTLEALKKEADLKKINKTNELKNLKNLYKLAPNHAIAEQILKLEQELNQAIETTGGN